MVSEIQTLLHSWVQVLTMSGVVDANLIVEYKCPFKHRLLDPKEGFLTPEIGGIKVGRFQLKSGTQYYHQVQIQMYVLELLSCVFVIWTSKGIFSVEVPYDKMFVNSSLITLQKFWLLQVVSLLMEEFG